MSVAPGAAPGDGLPEDPAGTAPPPGWYPDPAAEGRQRWWDGGTWSGVVWSPWVQQPAAQHSPPATIRRRADRAAEGPFIWWLSGLPFVNAIVWLVVASPLQTYRAPSGAPGGLTLGYGLRNGTFLVDWMPTLLGWAVGAACVVLAWLDERELRRRGVPGPFPWAWSLLQLLISPAAIVYLLGRAVVLHRRGRPAWRPLWAFAAACGAVVLLALAIALVVALATLRS